MDISNTKKLLIALAALICLIYLRYYLSSAPVSKIVQLSVAELTPTILMQKNPIVIDEPLVNPMSLLHTVFKYMYVYHRITPTTASTPLFTQSKARYLIISCKTPQASVQILNPRFAQKATTKSDDPPYIDVKLYENMCLILPFNWWYRTQTANTLTTIALEDMLTLTFGRIV